MSNTENESEPQSTDLEIRLQTLSSFEDILSTEELDSAISTSFPSENSTLVPSLPCMWDQYRLIKRIGGGMSNVYFAEQTNLGDKPVVIKIIGRQSEKRLALFSMESEILGRLTRIDSDGLVVPLDQKVFNDVPFIVMEHVVGRDLNEVIESESVSLLKALRWTGEIAETLSQVHRQGFIHGDLKPGNLMLTANGRTKVIDFGLSAYWDSSNNNQSFAGTRKYASPEQIDQAEVDHRTDIFSLGVVFDRLIDATNEPGAAGFKVAKAIASKMTREHDGDRYQSMAEAATAIDGLMARLRGRNLLKSRILFGAAIAIAISLAAFFFSQFSSLSPEQDKIAKEWISSVGGRFEDNPSGELKTAVLDGCDVQNEDIEIFQSIGSLEAVRFANTPLDEGCVKFLPASVDHFYFDRTNSGDRLFDELARFRVRLLSVTHAKISDAISDRLGEMQTIEQLDLGSNNIGDELGPAIAKLENLFMLSLSSTRFSDDGIKVVTTANPPLIQLHLAGCNVSDEGLKQIAGLTQLRELGLDYCGKITDDGFAEIAALKNLEIVRCEHTQISQAAAITTLKQLPNLREVFAKGSAKIDLNALQNSLGENITVHQE